jgi:hypothetical protein
MRDPLLAKKLENYLVPLPSDYREKITGLCAARGLVGLEGAIINFIDTVKNKAQKDLNAGQIVVILMTRVMKMIEQGPNSFSKQTVLNAIELGPEILEALISDEKIRRDTLTFYWNEMSDSKNQLASSR